MWKVAIVHSIIILDRSYIMFVFRIINRIQILDSLSLNNLYNLFNMINRIFYCFIVIVYFLLLFYS